ncbi:FkbM family methyltransferase [Candidatus Ruminimicrobiellum ovillum]|uniref:FkbM family methyltransferase n=1 Tax=Candidatus Ruminimicrobiellum ovillum TaxID=1947927 RepID=UPI003559BBE1
MNKNFADKLFIELNKQQVFSFEDIQNFQKKITDEFVKEKCIDYYGWFKNNYNSLEYFYNLLEDETEKQLYLKMIVSKLLGPVYVTEQEKEKYIHSRDIFDSLLADNSIRQLQSVTRKLKFYNLSKLGYDIKVYGARALLDKLIIHKQYSYKDCKVENGDFVIDAGACWGDTSLIFSSIAGNEGKIFTFEFFDDNLNILKENFSHNKKLADNIILTEQPVYNKSNKILYLNHACADITTLTENKNNLQQYKTICIDDFVEGKKIEKTDFIKMDIEGCELKALQGAVNTLKKYKPKLAIAAYHKYEDYYEIPKFLNELNLGYKFYFANYTLGFTDTVIYAK